MIVLAVAMIAPLYLSLYYIIPSMFLPELRPWIKRTSLLALLLFFSACQAPLPAATAGPPGCFEPGMLGGDQVPALTQGFEISFRYYLPPCYNTENARRYPVIYLLAVPFESRLSDIDQTPISLAERLIRSGQLPPVIIVVPEATIGFGYHAALARDLIPYIDATFRTLADPRQRGVGGISHGAAIAARMAFEFPETFGSLVMLSGGIDRSEVERFEGWVARTPVGQRPRVLILIGEQDGIWPLTSNFLTVLDRQQLPYRLERGPGDHNWAFWSARMETSLHWFAETW